MAISCSTHLALLVCFLVSTKPFGTFGFNIKLIPIDRFDTTLFPHDLSLKERYERISLISRARVRQLESKAYLGSFDRKMPEEHGPNALKPLITRHRPTGYYITTFLVSTYAYTPFLVVDTASDDTWMQCEGCTHCFSSAIGNFNRSRSRTYRPIAYNHPLCVPNLRVNGSCAYDNIYVGDGENNCHSKGQVGSDTFTIKDGTSSVKAFPNTVFGCGLENYNMGWAFQGENNTISGIFGLGLGVRSIFSQYDSVTKRRISYCLPSWTSSRGTYTMLQFGDDAQISRRRGLLVRTTTLIHNVSTYAINVTGITISGKRLNIDPIVFRLRSDGIGGFIFDTGCPHTVLVRAAYDVVKGEIIRYFRDRYSLHPSPPQPGRMDLCYDVPHGNILYPTMIFHFTGTYLFLDYKNVFHFFREGFCLVIMPTHNGGTSKLGAFQQANYRFLFDFRAYLVSFVPEECRFHE